MTPGRLGGQLEFGKIMANLTTLDHVFYRFGEIRFSCQVVAFWGEHGWRSHLSEILQKKFGGDPSGLCGLYGICQLTFFLCSRRIWDHGWQASLLLHYAWAFMAYAYMKPQNIWVPVIIHFLNNNMAVVFSEHTLQMCFRTSRSTEIFPWHCNESF